MAQAQNKDKGLEAALPILATAALNGSGIGNDELRVLLTELVQDQLDTRRKERQRRERLAAAAVESAKEEKAQREQQQKNCSHTKQDDSTRLAGQFLSGTGQLSLVCTFCGKNYFHPALPGQEEPPRHLIPSRDVIGG
jgi:putative protein kinase ArgK-like GTPase of G3E family